MHLLDCGLNMENKQLVMGNHTLDVCMKLALLKSVREQLQATPGVLSITVVHAVPSCNAMIEELALHYGVALEHPIP